MEIKELKIGDRFVKWDGKICTLETLNDCRARVLVHGLSRMVEIDERFGVKQEKVYNQRANISPSTEVLRVLGRGEEIPNIGVRKNGGSMKDENGESKKILDFSAKLPTNFTKVFKDKEFKLHRTGEDRWELNDKSVGGIRSAMNTILEATVGKNNGRTADSFFASALREPKAEKAEKPTPKAEKKAAKPKKKANAGKKGLKFSKEKQVGKEEKAASRARGAESAAPGAQQRRSGQCQSNLG